MKLKHTWSYLTNLVSLGTPRSSQLFQAWSTAPPSRKPLLAMDAETLPDAASAQPTSTTSLLLLLTTLVVFIVYFIINVWPRNQSWDKYGVKHVKIGIQTLPTLQWGCLMKEHGPTVGFIENGLVLVTRDPDLLKQIMIKDFNNFVDRREVLWSRSLMRDGLFFLRGRNWKRMRRIMSPTFSTGKLKAISNRVSEAARRLGDVFEKCGRSGSQIQLLHVTGQYTTSIIAKTAFGVEADSIGEEEDDQFTYFAKNILRPFKQWEFVFERVFSRFQKVRWAIAKILGVYPPDPCPQKTVDYFHSILEQSISERETVERQGSRTLHNDFLQNMVSLKIATDSANDRKDISACDISTKTLTTNEVIAQSMITIFAGYETTSSTLQFCLLKMAQNPDIQERVFQEVTDNVEQEWPTHEELAKLHYTEQVINETLRLFPPLTYVSRKATESRTYRNVTIPAGAGVVIPIREIQRDPSVYPDPEVFDPERFSKENESKRHPLSFVPFGHGPRICIGMRLAYLELKEALVHVVRKVKVEVNDDTVPKKGEDVTLDFMSFPRPTTPIKLAVKIRDHQ